METPIARLLALSDLHVNYAKNAAALATLPQCPDDHLLVPGDVGDGPEHLATAFAVLTDRYRSVTWTPGNHELWDRGRSGLRGVARYETLINVCREFGVHTPEDPPWVFEGAGGPALVVPLFLLYDYSFGPDGLAPADVVRWAAEHGIRASDERYLHADPFVDVAAWSADRITQSEARLDAAAAQGMPLVVTSHFPWRRDLVRFGDRIQRFVPWCGTRETEEWHSRWPISCVVHGHLHMRATDWRDGVRFEEVALGYPRHWDNDKGAAHYVREILPGPASQPRGGGPAWHF